MSKPRHRFGDTVALSRQGTARSFPAGQHRARCPSALLAPAGGRFRSGTNFAASGRGQQRGDGQAPAGTAFAGDPAVRRQSQVVADRNKRAAPGRPTARRRAGSCRQVAGVERRRMGAIRCRLPPRAPRARVSQWAGPGPCARKERRYMPAYCSCGLRRISHPDDAQTIGSELVALRFLGATAGEHLPEAPGPGR